MTYHLCVNDVGWLWVLVGIDSSGGIFSCTDLFLWLLHNISLCFLQSNQRLSRFFLLLQVGISSKDIPATATIPCEHSKLVSAVQTQGKHHTKALCTDSGPGYRAAATSPAPSPTPHTHNWERFLIGGVGHLILAVRLLIEWSSGGGVLATYISSPWIHDCCQFYVPSWRSHQQRTDKTVSIVILIPVLSMTVFLLQGACSCIHYVYIFMSCVHCDDMSF